MWQTIITGILVAVAVAYAAYHLVVPFRKNGKDGAGCASCTAECPLRGVARKRSQCPGQAKSQLTKSEENGLTAPPIEK